MFPRKAYRQPWLFGRCETKVGIEPFNRLVEQVMTTEPYASAPRVFWIVDNGSSHAGKASIERLQGTWENLCLVHLPYADAHTLRACDRRARGRATDQCEGRNQDRPARDGGR